MVIGEEAQSAALLLASMRVTETESLLECSDSDEPRTLSKVDQVGLVIIPCERCMSTTSSLSPFSFATRGLILRTLRSKNSGKREKRLRCCRQQLPTNRKHRCMRSRNSHLSHLDKIRRPKLNYTGNEWRGLKMGQSSFSRPYRCLAMKTKKDKL